MAAGVWRTESNAATQTVMAIVGLLVGVALIIGFRGYEGGGRWGFLLGIVVALLSIGLLLFGGRQAIVVDPQTRQIAIEHASLLGRKTKTIRFEGDCGRERRRVGR
ncbi:MAG: hypothetical protein JOZ54_09180 [Acidobacteria bacterium]|nr:hypothetical protein [Acidobacteriota bacterium]